ncbi:conserved hypothetical protein [Desulfatibacillum aliphaticivorans]|uniref:DUF4145 domain-containing protein n=1 Tax=Desulfatibacillum aliphaticivorans TaxID=218208 RepID=B8FCV1_DESAL|nr:DUF4145 domain-containing protein [Desulfatibacillum aliphaticivorans]ACL06382.1 conserved hypothetical protein [Desulfatibacillum aliphaticivorans]
MAELVNDCPRCGARQITFDITSVIVIAIEYEWQYWYEAFCICRHCNRSSIFVLSESVDGDYKKVHQIGLINLPGAVNRYVDVKGYINLKDNATYKPPLFVPADIEKIFKEGATCLSVGCYNAAGTMFRLCIDLVTRGMLPCEEAEGLNGRVVRSLGYRLPWLFDNGYLPEGLRDLSTCLREDGNDGAHAGNLTHEDAEDLLEFTTILLERIYTEPEKLRLAQERRNARRNYQA